MHEAVTSRPGSKPKLLAIGATIATNQEEFLRMLWRNSTVVALVFLAVLVASAANQHRPASKSKAKAKTPVSKPEPAAPQQQAPPQPPPTPEHGPSSPPEVSMQNGQLTIVARNSKLGDVLNAVRAKTGALVEMPGSSTERVVGQFGPGAPREVVAQLLNGSQYDYILIGSPADPAALKKVVLTVRATGPEQVQQARNPNPAYTPGQPQMDQDQPEASPDETTTDVQPDIPQQPEQQEEPQGEQPPQANPGGGPVVKTPEQLLRELQQQQQQQQQNQGQPPPQ